MTVGMIAPITVLQKRLNALFVEVRGRAGVSLEPAAEVGESAHHRRRGPPRLALVHHLVGTGVEVCTQRTSGPLRPDHWIGTT